MDGGCCRAGKRPPETPKCHCSARSFCAYTAYVLIREIGAFAEGTLTQDRPTDSSGPAAYSRERYTRLVVAGDAAGDQKGIVLGRIDWRRDNERRRTTH